MKQRGLGELWSAREQRVRAELFACESARKALEKGYAEGIEDVAALEAALVDAKHRLETERLRPSHFRCLRRKPGDVSVFQEVDLAVEDATVTLALVVLSSEPYLPPGVSHTDEAVSIWPNMGGTFEILVQCRDRLYLSELVKIVPVAETEKLAKKKPVPVGVRKFLLQWKSQTEELYSDSFDEIEETIGHHLVKYKRRKVARVKRAVELWESQRIPYDKTNQDHEAKLIELWTLVNPGVALTARVSDQWKTLGFQGSDPATDFRGMGLLGLNLLLFMARHRPDDIHKILGNRNDYPFACGAINVAALMFDKLGFSKLQKTDLSRLFHSSEEFDSPLMDFFCRVDCDTVFEETFSCLCLLTDARFMSAGATYMQFPQVIEWVKVVLAEFLRLNVVSVDQLRFLVEQRIMAMRMLKSEGEGRFSKNDL